ncbi:hypothetical protein EDD15DRAFT_2274400 [Pisolithus albus]|nr:hypothetical protein EDD15DRAFT_2274400 [Pisolithus albus]
MAPGLPCFTAHSSGTSGGATKHFPKYHHPDHMSLSTSDAMKNPNPPTSNGGGKNCITYCRDGRRMAWDRVGMTLGTLFRWVNAF